MSYWKRGREYVDYEEYLDEMQQYKLDALREGRFEKQREEEELLKEEEEGGEEG